jgi:hypothetical protein
MVKKKSEPFKRTVLKIAFNVKTELSDILSIEGCRKVEKCMERIAITRALLDTWGIPGHTSRVKIDAGTINFNKDEYRWEAKTPRIPKKYLILYDKIISRMRKQKKSVEEIKAELTAKIPPHEYKVIAIRGTKIIKPSRERQNQINEARRVRERRRKEEGRPVTHYTLRDRVIGFR